MATRLIVNADDFGHTRGINRGIIEAHLEGLVTSTTLMVKRPFAAEAAELALATPSLGVGLHVTLTGAPPGEHPVLEASEVPSLVDASGRLPRNPDGLANARADEVELEILAQLARFEELLKRPPTHLDSHHHSHRQPPVLEAMIRVAEARSIPVRNASPLVGAALESHGIQTTDAFIEEFFGEAVGPDHLISILENSSAGTVELMCHPGYVDDPLRRGSTYVEERVQELHTLCSPEVIAAAAKTVALISWDEL